MTQKLLLAFSVLLVGVWVTLQANAKLGYKKANSHRLNRAWVRVVSSSHFSML